MAATKILSIRQLPLLSRSICLSVSQRNVTKERTILKKLGLPQKPKRPPNGYFSFIAENRASLIAKNPNMSFTEVSQLLSKKWKELPESERQKYDNQFQRKFQQYKAEVKEYHECLTERQKCEINELITGFKVAQKERSVLNDVKKLEKEMNKPRRPGSPFLVFCNKHSETYKGIQASVKLKELGEKWRQLSDIEKDKYKVMYNKENEQYKKNLEKWEEQMIRQGNVDLIRLKTLREKVQNYVQ